MSASAAQLGFNPTLAAAIRRCAEQHGDIDYVVSLDRRMTFAEIERASAAVARRMLSRGIGKGTRVGLYFTYSHEWVIYWLAASRIGALVMPFSTVYAPVELGRVLRLSDAAVLITSATLLAENVADILAKALPTLADAAGPGLRLPEAPFLRAIWMSDVAERQWASVFASDAEPDADDADEALLRQIEREVVPSDQAVVVYTSGSSALPKGVIHTHGSILADSVILAPLFRGLSPPDLPVKAVCGMPFFWVGGILTLAGALLGPLTLLILPRFDVEEAMKLIEREKGTVLAGWPTLTQKIRGHPKVASYDLSSAPTIVAGPDVSMVDIPDQGAPTHRGMSETMGTFAAVDIKVVNPETGEQVPYGADGEMCVRGYGLMDGYYKKSRDEVFDEDGWFHTGDKVFRIEGDPRSFFRGRYTETIKCAGANVSPREVETVIEELPGVMHCFVFGVPDAKQEEAVVAVVAGKDGAALTPTALARDTRAALSGYKVPSRWILLDPEDIPWLGSGKPDKLRLRAMLDQKNEGRPPAADGSRPSQQKRNW